MSTIVIAAAAASGSAFIILAIVGVTLSIAAQRRKIRGRSQAVTSFGKKRAGGGITMTNSSVPPAPAIKVGRIGDGRDEYHMVGAGIVVGDRDEENEHHAGGGVVTDGGNVLSVSTHEYERVSHEFEDIPLPPFDPDFNLVMMNVHDEPPVKEVEPTKVESDATAVKEMSATAAVAAEFGIRLVNDPFDDDAAVVGSVEDPFGDVEEKDAAVSDPFHDSNVNKEFDDEDMRRAIEASLKDAGSLPFGERLTVAQEKIVPPARQSTLERQRSKDHQPSLVAPPREARARPTSMLPPSNESPVAPPRHHMSNDGISSSA